MFARARLATVFVVALVFAVSHSLALGAAQPPADPDAVFNTSSKIYHRPSCTSARRCTRNCIVIPLSEARKRGGRPCQICGGPTAAAAEHEPVRGGSVLRNQLLVEPRTF